MGDFVLSCCRAANLPKSRLTERDIHLPENDGDFLAYFEGYLKEEKDILHICPSSVLSGSFREACAAKQQLEEKYPEQTIYVVDSLAMSGGYALLMETLADMRDVGMEPDVLYSWAEEYKAELNHWYASSDLTYYLQDGRISGLKEPGFFEKTLGFYPIFSMDCAGRPVMREKSRSKKKMILRIVEKMEEEARDGIDYSGKCFLCHSLPAEEAQKAAELVESKFERLDGKVRIFPADTTAGTEIGTGTIALFFWGAKRED